MSAFFKQNLAALAVRYPQLAAKVEQTPPAIAPLPSRIESLSALLASIAPENNFTVPILIAGLDDGRLERQLHAIPCRHPALPGFKPPIYLLCRDIAQLSTVLHHQDWQAVLSDPRVLIFVGENAAEQFLSTLRNKPSLPQPKFALTVEAGILPANTTLDQFLAPLQAEFSQRCSAQISQYEKIYGLDISVASSPRLKILGITSRFTTFLQHSMRDWLSAMRKLGHETRLLIEDADHELLNTLCHAQTCTEFRPDLILIIDHCRSEFPALPPQIPSVMWVQDQLPNIFNPATGPKQSSLDFCLGYGRLKCVADFGYPEERFMPAVVGVNEQRFAPQAHGPAVGYECDVCYVGHTGKTAEQLVRDQIEKSPSAAKLLWDIYERLANIYAHAGFISDPLHIEQLVRQSLAALNISISPADFQSISNLFSHQVNYSFFRHQALQWLLDLDCNIHIYGRGWENHPTLSRFAKGVADNQKQLAAIYQTAKINLQIAPHGIVHQRLFEGLCSGGFFLLRHRPGDVVERIHKPIWDFCLANNIHSDAELKARATPQVQQILRNLERCIGLDPFNRGFELLADLRLSADSGFAQSAATLWPEQYDQVAFASQNELRDKVHYYLEHPDQRGSICTAMRQIVIDRMTYTATSRRLLEFIQKNLACQSQRLAA
ncbi:MAG TPA: glycosyltransferase [Tepidisphaeraceae bacterium]|jgi:hypothetical protein